ncbi:hypothetical protein GO755_40735, partial [Spirosoma sp. HMF4905]|nr:hypothetical protein [Spirosoma arboris]
MNAETKRKLLAQVLAGNTEALRDYQIKQAQQPTDSEKHLWIIDAREIGGSI